jgi:hypothetical protein
MEVKGETLDIHLPGITATVGDFRQRVADAMHVSSTPSDIRLIFNGKVLSDLNATVSSCGIEDGFKVLVAKKVQSGGASASSGAQKTRTPAPIASATSATAAANATHVPVSTDPIDRAIARIFTAPRERALTCLQTIEKICKNIKENPMDVKYRKLKVANAAFQRRVSGVPGGTDVLAAIGFKEVTDGGENHGSHVLTPSADLWNVLVSTQSKLVAAVQRIQSGGGGVGSGVGGGVGGNIGDMQGLASMVQAAGLDLNAMSGLAQQAGSMDPQAIQSMMQTAMSNPQVMQQLGPMMNNPQMMQQVQSMMSNPQMMQQAMSMVQQNPQMLQQMMSGGGMGGGLGGGFGGGFGGGGGGSIGGAPTPFAQQGTPAAAPPSSGVQVDEEKVQQMVAMGISADRAREALRITQNNVDYAVARLFG